MSRAPCDTPRSLHSAVAQRHLETEVANCVGGVISPLLLNIALHGMEAAAGVRYYKLGTDGAQTVAGTPALVRYADDFLVMCHTREQAEQVWLRLARWLEPRGLSFNVDKTRICLLYTSPSPRDRTRSRMPSSA